MWTRILSASCVVLIVSFIGIAMAAEPPAKPTWMELTVLDSITGKPLPDVRIKLSGMSGQDQIKGEEATDPDGVAGLTIPQGPIRYYSFTVRKEGYVPMRVGWPARGDRASDVEVPGTYMLRMEPATRIGGKVIDDAGQPVQKASVVLHVRRKLTRENEAVDITYETLKTDAAGTWHYDKAPAAFDSIDIGVYHPEYASGGRGANGFFSMSAFAETDKLRNGSATLTLPRGVRVEGVVLDAGNRPIAGAQIGIGQDRVASNTIPESKTDADGKFAVAAFPGDQVVITVKAKGYAPDLKKITLGEKPERLEFRLESPKTLRGRVVDVSGNPIRNVSVYADTWRGCRTLNARLTTDADGRFVWKDAPVDAVQFDIYTLGYADSRNTALTAGDEERVITLRKPLIVTGAVVDAETGKPIDSFKTIRGIAFEDQVIRWQREREQKPDHDGAFKFEQTYPYPGYAVRIEAPGYLPAESRIFRLDEAEVKLEFKLVKGRGIEGVIRLPDGSSGAGATVALAIPGQTIYLRNGTELHDQGCVVVKADEQGKYAFPPQTGEFLVVAYSDKGYCEVSGDQLAKSADITLTPWAQIDGEAYIGSKPADGAEMAIQSQRPVVGAGRGPSIYHQVEAKADADGKFTFPRVVPGPVGVARQIRTPVGGGFIVNFSQLQKVEAKAGETAHVRIGGTGRPVVGHVALPPEVTGRSSYQFEMCSLSTTTEFPKMDLPDDVQVMDPEARQKWIAEWRNTGPGKAYEEAMNKAHETHRSFAVVVQKNGDFRVDDIPAGDYKIAIQVTEPIGQDVCGLGAEIASGGKSVTIPEMPDGRSDEALDVGVIELKVLKTLKVGDDAPAFTVKTLSGGELKLTDFRGKYVLVDFWATWCGPCVQEMPIIKKLHESFGKDDRFAIIGLNVDEKQGIAEQFVQKQGLDWLQGFVGPWATATLPAEYGVRSLPATFLIGPDGKIVARDLRGEAGMEKVRSIIQAAPH